MTTGESARTRREWESRLFMTVAEAAQELGVDSRTVHRAIESGQIPGHRLSERVWRIPVARFLTEIVGVTPEDTETDPATGSAAANIRFLAKDRDGEHRHDPTEPAA